MNGSAGGETQRTARIVDALDLSFAVLAARKDRESTGPFPAARNVIFGTAFAVTSELFLTAAHVVQASLQAGDVALGKLGNPVGEGRIDVISDYEVFDGIDVALMRCPGFDPVIHELSFDRFPIFQDVQAVGFGLGLDPEYHSYAPRGFRGQIVSGHQLLGWRAQPLAYELSFVPPVGMSGAALVPVGYGAFACGVIVGSQIVRIEGNTTRLGIAIASDELLRVKSRVTGDFLSRLFGREPLPQRELVGPASQRLSELTPTESDWPDD